MTCRSGWIWVPLFCFHWFPSNGRFSHDHSAKQTMHQNEWIRVWTSFVFGTRISWFDSQNLISQDWTAIDKFIIFSILLDPRKSYPCHDSLVEGAEGLWMSNMNTWVIGQHIRWSETGEHVWVYLQAPFVTLGSFIECCLSQFLASMTKFWNRLLLQNFTIDDILGKVSKELVTDSCYH